MGYLLLSTLDKIRLTKTFFEILTSTTNWTSNRIWENLIRFLGKRES